jgi:hypothetical protein
MIGDLELTEFVPAIRMGIVRKVLLGLENRAGCIFSLLLNAFEWRLRFKFETGWEPLALYGFFNLSHMHLFHSKNICPLLFLTTR